MQRKKVKIFAPKSLALVLIQCSSIFPLIAAIEILILIVTSTPKTPSTFGDILILLFVIIFPLVLISFIMLYFPLRYRTLIIIDLYNNILRKKKKKSVQNFDISNVKSLVLKTTRASLCYKYSLILEDTENNFKTLLNENSLLGAGHWEIFATKLSTLTGLPLCIR